MVESERKRRKQKGLKMKKEIVKIIEKFVEENYGISEANNPSWDIESLAFEIVNKLKLKD